MPIRHHPRRGQIPTGGSLDGAANETITGDWTFTGTTIVPVGTVTAHEGSLTIAESQITDGTILARVASNETITGAWTFSGLATLDGGLDVNSAGTEVLDLTQSGSVAFNIVKSGTGNLNITNSGTGSIVITGTVSLTGSLAATGAITGSNLNISNWDTAYGWGDHSLVGYITGITASPLSDLSDVTITTIAAGEILKWDGVGWINNTLAEAGISATSHTHTGVYEPADATILKDADIGVTVQAYDVDTAKRDVTNTFTAYQEVVLSGGTAADMLHFRDSTDTQDFVFRYDGAWWEIRSEQSGGGSAWVTFGSAQAVDFPGSVTGGNLNITNWDTAYGWGNHASAGYITGITGSPLSDLSDVTITTIASGEILKWNGTGWINNTLAEAGIAADSHTHTGVYEPADATILKDADIGVTVAAFSHTHSYQPLDADLTAIAALAGTSGFLTKTATDTWALDTSTYSLSTHNHSGVYEPVDATLVRATITTIAAGELLKWNGTAWINNTLAEAGIAAASHTHTGVYEPADATILKDADIGVTVQAYNANNAVTNSDNSFSVEQTFAAGLKMADSTVMRSVAAGGTYTWYYQTSVGNYMHFGNAAVTASFYGDVINIVPTTSMTIDGAAVSATLIGNWNTAYGWGNHAGLYSLTSHTHTGVYEPADATILKDADIGGTVAAFSHTHTGVYEPALGNPASDGYVLSSTALGVRSWIAAGGAEVNDLTAAVTWANIPIANVPTGTTGSTVALGNHTHTGVYEPADSTIVKATITTIASGEILKWNGSAWINNTLTEADIAADSAVVHNTGNETVAGVKTFSSAIYRTSTSGNADIRLLGNTSPNASVIANFTTGEFNIRPDEASATDDLKWTSGTGWEFEGALTVQSASITSTLIGQWNTAYGWGNHASVGYITGITGSPLSDLSDVTITTIASGEILKWNGTGWINNTLAEAGILATTAIGTTVQAYDADLTTWAGITPSANAQSLVSAANYAAMRTLLDLEAGTDFYSIAAADAAFEGALGNPGTDGYVLSSTTTGTRSWIAPGGSSASETKYKTADEALSAASTTLQNDDHMAGYTLTAGAYYAVEGYFQVHVDGTTGGDFKCQIDYTNTPTDAWLTIEGYGDTGSSIGDNAQYSSTCAYALTAGLTQGIHVKGFIIANATTGGTCTLQWAKNSLGSGFTTTMLKGSWMTITKIS